MESEVQQQYLAIHNQLNIGDIILVTGSKKPSKWLVNAQKLYYKKSSHTLALRNDIVRTNAHQSGIFQFMEWQKNSESS